MTTTSVFSGYVGNRASSRVIKAPGGGSSQLFNELGPDAGQVNGERRLSKASIAASETDSVDGSVCSFPSLATAANGTGYDSDASSVASSACSSRRGSLQETKSRLFGQNEIPESPRRRVVDRMKSNIFQEPVPVAVQPVPRSPSVKYEHVIDRNPITGEVYNNAQRSGNASGRSSSASSVVDSSVPSSASSVASMPTTPTRSGRQPPGGRTSNIFG